MTKTKYKRRRRQNKAGKRNFAIGRLAAMSGGLRSATTGVHLLVNREQWKRLVNAQVAIQEVYEQLAYKYYRRK